MGWWTAIQILVAAYSATSAYKAAQKAKQLNKQNKPTGIEITRNGTDHAIPVVLGRRKISPIVVYKGTQENPYLDNKLPNERYYAALVWSVGEIEEIEEMFFDDKPVSEFGFTRYAPGQTVTYTSRGGGGIAAQYTIPEDSPHYYKAGGGQTIEHRLGKDEDQLPQWFKDQVADDLTGMEFRGLAVTFVFLEQDANFKNYPSGEPEFSAIVKGKKIPDLSTGTTHATSNFASQVYWYLTNQVGLGASVAELDTAQITEMAKFCDILESTDQGTVKRLESNIVIDTSQSPFDVLQNWFKDFNCFPVMGENGLKLEIGRERILTDVNGNLTYSSYSNGVKVDTGKPVFEITEKDLIGGLQRQSVGIENKFNQAIIRFNDESQNFAPNEITFPKKGVIYPGESVAFYDEWVSKDGKLLSTEDTLDTITSAYHAEQYAETLVKTSRESETIVISVGVIGFYFEVMDVVVLTIPNRGWNKKPFEIRQLKEKSDSFELTLVEYQDSNYAWSTKTTEQNFLDTTLPDPLDISAPTGLSVEYIENRFVFTWDDTTGFRTNYLVQIFDDQGEEVTRQKLYNNRFETQIFVDGNYTIDVSTQNTNTISAPATLGFSTQTPAEPTISLSKDALNINVVAVYVGNYFNVSFEAKYNTVNDIDTAVSLGEGSRWTITNLTPNTKYFVWARTKGITSNSNWVASSATTDAQAQNVAQAVSGLIDIPNLATAAQDTINQIKADIVTNTNANAATDLALQVTNSNLSTIEYSLGDTFTDAFNVINDNITFREELLGTKAQVEALDGQVTANATAITQSATKIELESVEVQLRGEIQNILTGDIDAILEGAIGDLQGEVTQVKFFIGEDNLDGQQTITSFVNNIVLGQDFVTINQVQQEIDSGGITGIVTQATFNSTTTTLNNNIERLGNNVRTEYLSSFAFMTDQNTSINAALVEAQLKSYNAQLALAEDSESFEGSISSIKSEQTVLSDEVSAQAQSVTEQIARIDNNISITNTTLNNLSTRTESIASIQTELKAQVDDGLGAAVLRLDQAESDIQGNANAVSLVQGQVDDPDTGLTASYQLAQAAQTTANGAVSSVTVLQNTINDEDSGLAATLTLATSANQAAANNAAEITGLKTSTATISATANTAVENAATANTAAGNAQTAADNAQGTAEQALSDAANSASEANAALNLAATANTAANTVAAEAFLYVDANGKVAGVKASASDTEPSDLKLVGEKISIETADGSIVGLKWDAAKNKFTFEGEIFAKDISGDVIELAEKNFTPNGTLAIGVLASKTLLGQFILPTTGFNRTIKIDPMAITIPTSGDAVTLSLEKVVTGNWTSVKKVYAQYNQANQIQIPPLVYDTDGTSNTYRLYAYRALSGGQPPYFPQNCIMSVLVNKTQGSIAIT